MLVTSGIASCVGCRRVFPPNLAWKHEGCVPTWVVVHREVVVHAKPGLVVHKSRHGVYADLEARRKYKREWMARKRAERKAA